MKLPDPSPQALVRYHASMMALWVLLVVPTLLVWKESILWVAFMSLYANFVGHFASYDAAKGEADLMAEVVKLRKAVEALQNAA